MEWYYWLIISLVALLLVVYLSWKKGKARKNAVSYQMASPLTELEDQLPRRRRRREHGQEAVVQLGAVGFDDNSSQNKNNSSKKEDDGIGLGDPVVQLGAVDAGPISEPEAVVQLGAVDADEDDDLGKASVQLGAV